MSCVPYVSAVGILMYPMVCTRLDITHAMGVLSRYMSKPGMQWMLLMHSKPKVPPEQNMAHVLVILRVG
jgi:hypothetical protein